MKYKFILIIILISGFSLMFNIAYAESRRPQQRPIITPTELNERARKDPEKAALCDRAEMRVTDLISKMENRNNQRKNSLESFDKNISKLITRAKELDLNTSNVEKEAKDVRYLREKLITDHSNAINALNMVKEIQCGTKPGDYKERVKEARDLDAMMMKNMRETLQKEVSELRVAINNLKNQR